MQILLDEIKSFEQTPPAADGRALKEGGETIMGKKLQH